LLDLLLNLRLQRWHDRMLLARSHPTKEMLEILFVAHRRLSGIAECGWEIDGGPVRAYRFAGEIASTGGILRSKIDPRSITD
jgi:hypothetical protein